MYKKQNLGQFNTISEAWLKPQVLDFIHSSKCLYGLDPFAGQGNLMNVMTLLGFSKVIGLDIDESLGFIVNDSLIDIPYYENTIVITNPPYLAKNSAVRHSADSYLYFDMEGNNDYIDLYQIALRQVLRKYDWSVFIIPETFILNKDFKDHLYSVTIIEDSLFEDTDCPVCVACFKRADFFEDLIDLKYDIYKNNDFLFTNIELQNILKEFGKFKILNITFNDRNGNVGLRAVDGINPSDRIKFCKSSDINYDIDNINDSSRSVTVINVSRKDKNPFSLEDLIEKANRNIEELRKKTYDVVFAPFKNNNKDGIRRRRLDYRLARLILNNSII